jgi:AraC family transcriptional regulator of arabinose operon
MRLFQDAPDPIVSAILTGYLHQGRRYATSRARGSRTYLLMYTLSGCGTVATGKSEHLAGEGDLVLYEPHRPQAYGTEERNASWEILWAHFHPREHWTPLLDLPAIEPGLRLIAVSPDSRQAVGRALRAMHEADLSGGRWDSWRAMNYLEAALIELRAQMREAGTGLSEPIRKAVDRLHSRLAEPLDLADLARHTGLSASRLAHRFADELGVPPRRYQEQRRLERARQLLIGTAEPIRSIALSVGFPNEQYFATRFRLLTGVTPSAYREAATTASTSASVSAADKNQDSKGLGGR